MTPHAQVKSLEAVETFRNILLIYLAKAKPALEHVTGDVTRLRMWLQHEQRMHWETEARRRTLKLEEAQQQLYSARLANLRDTISAEQLAVQKAKRSMEEAQQKLNALKLWGRDFDAKVMPLLKVVEKLETVLSHDMEQGARYLHQVLRRLDEYRQIGLSGAVGLDVPPTPAKSESEKHLPTEEGS